MNQLVPLPSLAFSSAALVGSGDDQAQRRFREFFAVTSCNPHTRRAYAQVCGEFLGWYEARGVASIAAVQ